MTVDRVSKPPGMILDTGNMEEPVLFLWRKGNVLFQTVKSENVKLFCF